MKIVKKTDKYLFVQKRNGRYGVKTLKGQWINGEEKAKLLAAEGYIKLTEKAASTSTDDAETPEESNADSNSKEETPNSTTEQASVE